MSRTSLWLALAASTGLVAAVCVGAKTKPEQPTVTLLFPKETADGLLWPNNGARVFAVRGPDSAAEQAPVSFVVRSIQQQLKKGVSPAIGERPISKAESKNEMATAELEWKDPAEPIVVFIQVIDLSTVARAAGEVRFNRLRVGMARKGLEVSQGDSEKTLLQGQVVGITDGREANWKDGELHLINLFVLAGEQLTTYDFVLVQRH